MSEPRSREPDQPDDLTAGPQPEAAVRPAAPEAPVPPVLHEDDRRLLAAVLDRIVPPNEALPGAGGLGVAAFVERSIGGAAALRRLFLSGLAEIAIEAARQGGHAFEELAADQQDAVLRRVEEAHPAFFAALVNHTYRGYYTHRRVLAHLEATAGYPARPPQPLGHEMPRWDDALLQRQRDRAPFWRRT